MKRTQNGIAATILAGLKKNLVPGLILQGIALALVLAYYFLPGAGGAFDKLGALKARYGLPWAAVTTALFGGAIPFLILLAMKRIERGRAFGEFLFLLLFWGYKGIEIDFLYRFLGTLFGTEPAFLTVLPKVLVDQFVYGPLWAGPTMTLGYLWKDSRFSLKAMGEELKREPLYRRILTVWCSSLAVWIPAVSIIYSLPQNLQLPLFNIILCFFSLILALVARGSEKPISVPST